jgi:hypothetical protein
MWEARPATGVRKYHQWWPAPGDFVASAPIELEPDERARMISFLDAQVGKRYDWASVLRFVSRRKTDPFQATRRWFCSELAHAAWTVGTGIPLLRLPSSEISPGLLAASPFLIRRSVFDNE